MGQVRGSWLCRENGRQEYRIQETEFRIRYSPSAQPENIKCVGAKRHHSILTPDFWLLNSEFQHRLSLEALSKGKPKPGPLGQDSLLQLLRICYRPFCFDWMILVATALTIPGFGAAMRRRREELNCIAYSGEKIFQIISSANQANRQVIESSVSS